MELDVEADDDLPVRQGGIIMDVDEPMSSTNQAARNLNSRPSMWLPSGPTVDMIYDWAPQLLEQIRTQQGGHMLLSTLMARATDGIHMTTQYTGMGCAEMAMDMIMRSLEEQLSCRGAVTYWSGTDNDPMCRSVLKRSCVSSPQHVFGDLLRRVSSHVLDNLLQIHSACSASFDSGLQQGALPSALAESLGKQMMQQLWIELSRVDWDGRSAMGRCFKCRKQCRLHENDEVPRKRLYASLFLLTCGNHIAHAGLPSVFTRSSVP